MASISAFSGSVPANYDKYLGPILFEPYALDLAERLKNDDIQQMLELACGTGRVTRHLISLVPDDGKLIATDLNPAMMEIARSKIQSDKVEWQAADAQNLHFIDNSFDHVVCQYGVMFFPDKPKGFAETYRVLKAGGKYLFNTWDSLDANPRVATMWKVMYEIFGDEAPDFLQKGPYSFFNKIEIEKLLLEAGFKNISIKIVKKTSRYNDADDLIKGFADGSPLNNYLVEKDENVKKQFIKRLHGEMKEQEKIYGNIVPMQALVCEALK